jgi:AcrR family transcriptional regulator
MQASQAKTKWELKREASYERLVGSAMRQFHEHGYAATRVEDIVAGTGYSPGAFYFHFANKADCFWHALAHRERLRGDWTELPDVLDPAATSLAQVVGRVLAHFSESMEGLNEWVLVMVDFHQQHRDDEEALEKLALTYRDWHKGLTQLVASLQQGGWVAPERDPALLATQIFAYGEGLAAHARLYGLDEDATQEAMLDGLVRILEGGASDASRL